MRFLDHSLDEVRAALAEARQPAYRADQLARWVYRDAVTDPAAMTNVPARIARRFVRLSLRPLVRSESDDGTLKILVECADGETIETVLIPTKRFATACLSTQVGCATGCVFCASGLGGLTRNLTAGEILEQLIHLRQATASGARHDAGGHASKLTHVVLMGMGEPLANYAATVAAVRAIIDPQRFGLSARHVTVSTVGLPRAMRRLAQEGLPINLAVSLHAPDDALRQRLIPGAAPLAEVLGAAGAFFASRGREVTLEYVLLAGINDRPAQADALAQRARAIRANVNLIPLNPVEGLPYERPSEATVRAFAGRLKRRGVNVHIRRSRGADADAACGQLRRRRPDRPPNP